MRLSGVLVCVLLLCVEGSLGDASCTDEDLLGTWVFHVSKRGHDKNVNCSAEATDESTMTVTLQKISFAEDELGNTGSFTFIYNEGFEVVINNYKWFAFIKTVIENGTVTKHCDQTLPGWVHDVLGNNWACFVGKKVEPVAPRTALNPMSRVTNRDLTPYKRNSDFIESINSNQTSWRAVSYSEYDTLTLRDLEYRAGGPASRITARVRPIDTASGRIIGGYRQVDLPERWDWRDVNGVNYVSPVRNQGDCGSCYSFATMGMLEARIRILTNNSQTPIFSPQHVVSCSPYSEGCNGGFPYLTGKYVQEFGIADESCFPYIEKDSVCSVPQSCSRVYTAEYGYVGGFYGGCSEEAMMEELVQNGPISVAFEVYADFYSYKEGIYFHTKLWDFLNPFGPGHHAVVLVGYGQCEETGQKYWIAKNSWNDTWGEDGYFRIRRGNDECAIESAAVTAKPIIQL